MEYKMKLAGVPQWAIGIQYSQAWIGFNVTGLTIIPNNMSFFVNINLADRDQQLNFTVEIMKKFLYSKFVMLPIFSLASLNRNLFQYPD